MELTKRCATSLSWLRFIAERTGWLEPCRLQRSAAVHGTLRYAYFMQLWALSWVGHRRDVQVPLWLNRARAQHGVFSSVEDLPAIQVSTDHQCIVWCHQVVTHTATTLLKLASGAQLDRSQPKSRYDAVLQRRYPPLPEPAPAMGFPSRQAIAVWAVVSLPKLPALCAASVAAFASEVRYVTRLWCSEKC